MQQDEKKKQWALKDVARRLEASGVAWVVFAGAAATVYGADRPLTDVDILVPSSAGERLVELFPEGEIKRDETGGLDGICLQGFDIIAGRSGSRGVTGRGR